MTYRLLRIFVLAAALIQIATPALINPFEEGRNPARVAEPSQIEPAGYAFAIWGPIYFLALVYAVYQFTRAGRADPVTARIAPYALILYLGAPLWLAAVQFGPLWATIPILAIMVVCACMALALSINARAGGNTRLLAVIIPFGLYAGWVTCAVFVNIAEVAPGYGFDRFGLPVPVYAALSLSAATLLAAIMLVLTRGALSYAAAVVWALAAIIVAARARGHDDLVVYAAAAGIAITALVAILVKNRGANSA